MYFNISKRDASIINEFNKVLAKNNTFGYNVTFLSFTETQFVRLIDTFNKLKTKKTVVETIDYQYNPNKNTSNTVETLGDDSSLIHYIHDFEMLLTVETKKETKGTLETKGIETCTKPWDRARFSFTFEKFIIDASIFTNGQEKHYEIKINIVKNVEYKDIIDIMYYILKIKQESIFIISVDEKLGVLKEFDKFDTSTCMFLLGPSVKINEFYAFRETRYKSGFLYFDISGNGYIVSDGQVSKTEFKSNNLSTIVSVEYYKGNKDTGYTVIIDDIFVFNGVIVRDAEKYILSERLKLVDDLLGSICKLKYYKISKVKWAFDTISYKVMDEKSNLIFTSTNVSKSNSIDYLWNKSNVFSFYLNSISDTNNDGKKIWKLNTTNKKTWRETKDIKVSGEVDDLDIICNYFDLDLILNKDHPCDFLLIPVPSDTVNSITGLSYKYQINEKIQMVFDGSTFVPETTGKFLNYYMYDIPIVYNRVYNKTEYLNVIHKIIQDDTFATFKSCQDLAKKILLETHCIPRSNLLDLCSGKCYDYSKYKSIGLQASAWDIIDLKDKRNDSFCVYNKGDLLQDGIANIIHDTLNEFDNVSCFYGSSIFFESKKTLDNLIDILDTNLKIGGKFLVIYLSSQKVSELLNGKYSFHLQGDNGDILLYIQRKLEGKFGNKTCIYIKGSHCYTEYNTNFGLFNEYTADKYFLESQGSILDLVGKQPNLKKHEKIIEDLFEYSVYTRKVSDILPLIESLSIKSTISESKQPPELGSHTVFCVTSLNVVTMYMKIIHGIVLENFKYQEINFENIQCMVKGKIDCVLYENGCDVSKICNTKLNLYNFNNILYILWKPPIVAKLQNILAKNNINNKGVKVALLAKIRELIEIPQVSVI
jgi:hypothetical protein